MIAVRESHHHDDDTIGQDIIEDGNSEFAPIACSNCRRSHRRCDRKLPVCGECIAKKKKCTFLIPKKRGPLATTSSAKAVTAPKYGYHPYINNEANNNSPPPPPVIGGISIGVDMNNTSSEQDMIQKYMAAQTMDIYFEIVCLGFPLMERHKMELLLYYHHNMNSTKAPANEELALMYAIQAFCYQRIGQRTLAQQFFERSRATLSLVFDQVIYSFPVAACYCYLAYYLISDDELDKAKFFLHNVNQYLDHRKQQYRLQRKQSMPKDTPQQMVRETFLQQLVVICNILIQNSLNDFNGQLFNLGKLIKLFHTLTIYKSKEIDAVPAKNEPLPLMPVPEEDDDDDDPDKLCKYMDSITLDESATRACKSLPQCSDDQKIVESEPKSPSKTPGPIMDCLRVERISVAFQRFFDSLSGRITEMQLDILKLTFLIIAQGVKIQFLVKSCSKLANVALQTADRISALTGTHWFAMCPPLVISAVINAAKVHLQYFENPGITLEERLRLVNIMREDLRGLNLMKAKYNLVSSRYSDVVAKLEQVQKQFEEQQSMFISFMNQIGKPDSPSLQFLPAFNFGSPQVQQSQIQEISEDSMNSERVPLNIDSFIEQQQVPPAPEVNDEEDIDTFIDTLLNDNTLLTPTTSVQPDDLLFMQ